MGNARVTRECENCGKTKEMYRSEAETFRFCSRKCLADSQRVEKEKRQCENCGDGFEVYPNSPNAGRFCSMDCHREWQKLTKHPLYLSSEGLIKEMVRLGEELGHTPTRPDMMEHGKYSAKPYYNHFGSWARTVELTEQYLGGDVELEELPEDHYGGGWQDRRLEIIRRDNHVCQDCGLTEREHREKFGRRLHVHHRIDPGLWENRSDAHIDLNVVTVCTGCHGARHPETGFYNRDRGPDGRYIS